MFDVQSLKGITNLSGEAFIPYYTGQAIDGIVIDKSMEHFTKPLITLASLAFVRCVTWTIIVSNK